MNALVPLNPGLPAHLQGFGDLLSASEGLDGGIGSSQPPFLSIKGSRFTLVDGDEMAAIQTLSIDVVVLTGNQHASRAYFPGKYDPTSADPPVCFSDNGIGPSVDATQPQAPQCSGCPQAVWGSKINELGNKIPACGTHKKLAVTLAGPTQAVVENAMQMFEAAETVYQLRVPVTSGKAWQEYYRKIKASGTPVAAVVTRLSFVPGLAYPQLKFDAVAYIDAAIAPKVRELAFSEAAQIACGMLDKPITSLPALSGSAVDVVQALPHVVTGPLSSGPAITVAAAAPLATTPAAPSPAPVSAALPAGTTTDGNGATPKPRGRPKKDAAAPAVSASAPAPAATATTTPALANGQTVVASVPQVDPALAGTLDKLFGAPA